MTKAQITLNQVPIEWELDHGELKFLGISAVLFWTNPSLYRMLAPLADELGAEMFRLLVAQSSTFGTREDYEAMVTQLGSTFEEGFLAWGKAVSAAGWGSFLLPSFDRDKGTAVVIVRNPWELRMLKGTGHAWGCPFLLGKVIGIFNHALGRSCWADERVTSHEGVDQVEFHIHPSELTIDREMDRLRSTRLEARELELTRRVEEASAQLRQRTEELEKQQAILRALSAPVIQVWKGVLVVPLSGEMTAEQSEHLSDNLLPQVVALRAREVILDLTGLATVDAQAGDQLARVVGSLRLVGARCTIVGIVPAIAQVLTAQSVDLRGTRTLQTLADALRDVVGLREAERKQRGAL